MVCGHEETVEETYLNRQMGRCILKGGKPTADLTLSSTMITKQKQLKQQANISAKTFIKNKQNKNNLFSRNRITLGIKKVNIQCILQPTIPVNHFVLPPLWYSFFIVAIVQPNRNYVHKNNLTHLKKAFWVCLCVFMSPVLV